MIEASETSVDRFDVGVLDPQDEQPPEPLANKPVEERCTDVST
jgi:hypothetical protein